MSNEVSTSVFGGKVSVTDMKSLAQKAQTAAQNNPRGGAPNGSDYLNFSGKRGLYTIGKEKRRINDDERWVVDVTSFEEGWVCWKNQKPEASRMANIYTGVPVPEPDPEERGPFNTGKGEGWSAAKAMVLRSVDSDNCQGYFKNNSVSGVAEFADLMEAFSARAAAGEACWPLVRLDVEEFEAQGFKNFKPIFQIDEWLTSEQVGQLGEGVPIDDILDGTAAVAGPADEGEEGEDEEDEVDEAPAPRARPRSRAKR